MSVRESSAQQYVCLCVRALITVRVYFKEERERDNVCACVCVWNRNVESVIID